MYDVAFILRGSLRKAVLCNLEKPKTAKALSKDLNKHIQSVSRSLLELKRKGLVQCMNPKDDRFRFYKITQKGEDLLEKIKEVT